MAREAEKRLRKERLQAAKSRFMDNGHVSNNGQMAEGEKGAEGGDSQAADAIPTVDSNGNPLTTKQREQLLLVKASQQRRWLATTADFTSGLDEDNQKKSDGNNNNTPSRAGAGAKGGNSPPARRSSVGGKSNASPRHSAVLQPPTTNADNDINAAAIVSAANPQQQLIITAALLATSGLPPDILKSGAVAINNMTAAAQLLLLARQAVMVAIEERVTPTLATVRRCFATRQGHVPESEKGYHDAVEKSLITAIQSLERNEQLLREEKVKVEDVVAYVDGIRKTITARLPFPSKSNSNHRTSGNANGGHSGRRPPAAIKTLTDPTAAIVPLPQVKAEQPIEPVSHNLVALATGKRRRIPVQDTQAAISAAEYAYRESIATTDAAQAAVRAVKKDCTSLLNTIVAALGGKVRDNKNLQRQLVEQMDKLSHQLRGMDAFIVEHNAAKGAVNGARGGGSTNSGNAVILGGTVVSTAAINGSPSTIATSAAAIGTSSSAVNNIASSPHVTQSPSRGAGVFIAGTDRAIKHVLEDKERVVKVIAQLTANLEGKRGLEVVDVEVLRVIESIIGNGNGGGQSNSKKVGFGGPICPRSAGGGGGYAYQQTASSGRGSNSNNGDGEYHNGGYGYAAAAGSVPLFPKVPAPPTLRANGGYDYTAVAGMPSGASSGRSSDRSHRSTATATEQRRNTAVAGSGAYMAGASSDVDDLLSGRGSVSTRSAKVKAAAMALGGGLARTDQVHQHHYHEPILHHHRVIPSPPSPSKGRPNLTS